jgi:hypothetical protein
MFFNDVEQDPLYQYRMNKRLLNLVHGGAIFYEWSS